MGSRESTKFPFTRFSQWLVLRRELPAWPLESSLATVAMLVVAVIAGSIDNVLRPMLARGSSELPFVWMMVAFVGGVTAFGAAGVVLGPLVMALAVALWERHEEDHRARGPQRPRADRASGAVT